MKLGRIILACAAVAGGAMALAVGQDAPGMERPLKVLTIGNSFSRPVVFNLPPLAKAQGFKLDIASMYIGGCSLERHANNIEKAAKAYETKWDYVSEGEPGFAAKLVDGKGSIQDMLAGDKWDVVTIQQVSSLSWRPDTYTPWGDRLIAEIRRLAPQAQIFFQQTWSYNAADKRIRPGGEWGFDQQEMFKRIKEATAKFAGGRKLRIIPVGEAIEEARRKGGEDPVGKGKDNKHLNKYGERIQARVWLETLQAFANETHRTEDK